MPCPLAAVRRTTDVAPGTSATVAVSIGIGHAPDCIGGETLEEADRAPYRAKDGRR